MKDFSNEDFIKLIKFYKDKVSDLELQYLSLQISSSNEIKKKEKKIIADYELAMKNETEKNNNKIIELEKEITKLNKKIAKLS